MVGASMDTVGQVDIVSSAARRLEDQTMEGLDADLPATK